MTHKRVQRLLLLLLMAFLLSACDQIEGMTEQADVSHIEEAKFYTDLQETVARVQGPVIFIAMINLMGGWKLKRFGLMLNGFVIGALMIYTYLHSADLIDDENTLFVLAGIGGAVIGILAYFLYNLMALLIGGAIGTTLMGGTWLQIAEQVPPQVLVFLTTFVSAMLMFVVFRLFLVAFSAVIGAVMLMVAVPFEPLWVIPMVGLGVFLQSGLAWWFNDDIFSNLRGDLGAAVGEAFGEVLGPFATLRDRQRESAPVAPSLRQSPSPYDPAAQPQPPRYSPPPQQPAQQAQPPVRPHAPAPQQPGYQQPYAPPAYQQPPAAPPLSYQPPAQQPYYNNPPASQPPTYQPPQPSYQPPHQQPYAAPSQPQYAPPHQQQAFRPDLLQISLSDGRTFPLQPGHITVGRNPDNVIVINDAQVSGSHLVMAVQPDGIMVWDNNSTNGTYLNGVPLRGSYRLSMQDVLQVGAVTLRLTSHPEAPFTPR